MKRLTLTQRLSLVFAVSLLACSAVSAWLQIGTSARHEQEVVQRVSFGLAEHIAGTARLMDSSGWRPQAARTLFHQLMAVNPSVELYLLDSGGHIVSDAAPAGHLKRGSVDLAPIARYLAGERLPILGDDPRSLYGRKVFSAAHVRAGGANAGYVYVVLQGESHDAVADARAEDRMLKLSLWTLGVIALLALAMGLIAFRSITRPLRALTDVVRGFDANGLHAAALGEPGAGRVPGDEIAVLRDAFGQLGRRIVEQWGELSRQDQQRRDLIANISHDLRTPLTSLHGYLETLRLKDEALDVPQRRRYLDIALDQSRKVGHLAQTLCDLARLESGLVHPDLAVFALPELVQDVVQKCELEAQARRQRIDVYIAESLPRIRADLGMIERVLTHLLDNAVRHTPEGTQVRLKLNATGDRVAVEIADDGPGIPAALRDKLFVHACALRRPGGGSGGLGLIVAQRLLRLQGGSIQLIDCVRGTTLRFYIPIA